MTTRGIAVVGASAGGLRAFRTLLDAIGPRAPQAIVLVLHRHERSENLAETLEGPGRLAVREPYDKEEVAPGIAWVAPAGYHLLIDGGRFALSVDPPIRYSRPSIDALFSSAADAFGDRTTGVVLTGANADGAEGLVRIAHRGGTAIVQDPTEAEVPVMPEAAAAAVPSARRLPLAAIGEVLRTGSHSAPQAAGISAVLP